MRKTASILAVAAMLSVGLTGCTTTEITPASKAADVSGKLTGSMVMSGSTSMKDVCAALNEAFKKKNPGVTVTLGATGSGAAMMALGDGSAQIGNLSRRVKDTENPNGKYETITIAQDGIAVVVNPNNSVENLTREQLTGIFTGTISNWKDVGGKDKKITVIGREAGSGTRDGIEDILKIADKVKYAITQDSTGGVVAKVAGDESAVGYVSFAAVQASVKALKVGNVSVSESTIADNTYPIQRPFVHAYLKETTDPVVRAYLEFLKTAEAQDLIKADKLVANEFWK